jgi:hypothetical protein
VPAGATAEAAAGARLVEAARSTHPERYVVVAPPRTCSTLLARILWNVPEIGFYVHEPFDGVYHRGWALGEVAAKLASPVDLSAVPGLPPRRGAALLVKELPFQVGPHFPLLLELASRPIVFLVRDPRLAVASRMRMRELGGQQAVFDSVESGWTTLAEQVELCRREDRPHLIVDAADLRTRPAATLQRVCATLGLSFDPSILRWSRVGDVDLGLALDEQRHWNARVLESTGIEPPVEEAPPLDAFPVESGMREHVRRSLAIYEALRSQAAPTDPAHAQKEDA